MRQGDFALDSETELLPADQPAEDPAGDVGAGGGLSDYVYHKLYDRISRGDFPRHAKLPSEHQLARAYGVSRPVVREALRRLRRGGLIYSRQGSGSFVKVAPDRQAAAIRPVGSVADIQRCYEFRISIEGDSAFFAAQRANAAAVTEIEAAMNSVAQAARADRYHDEADFAFHYAIAKASNNRYYMQALTAIKDHVSIGMKVGGARLVGPEPSLSDVVAEHVAVFEAIRDRNAETARREMQRHIAAARARVFEGKHLDLSL